MFKRIWNWLFKEQNKKPSPITGDPNGLSWDEAKNRARSGKKVRRLFGWATTWYIRFNPITLKFEKWDSRGCIDLSYVADKADAISCDWYEVME